jgi:NAD(P)-dependent dehydrogenase (short-subunit alcohol dehydrogenase family)
MLIQRVAITGGARGIGRATAEACLRAGLTVVIGDIDAAHVAAAASELGERAVGLPLDVRDPDGFEKFLIEAEERVGPLDALVNNAGGATYAATKHAVVGFTRAIRAETRGTGVRTTIVMPGRTQAARVPARTN